MKKFILALSLMLLSIGVFGQQPTKKELKYIPKSFDEALVQLDKILPDSTKTLVMSMTETEFISNSHFGLGMWIRNEWLYKRLAGFSVGESELRKDLESKGLFTNDDMSGIILRSYYRKLNNQNIDFEQQVADIHQWYRNVNDPVWRAKQDSIAMVNYRSKYQIGDTLITNLYYKRNVFGMAKRNTTVMVRITTVPDDMLQVGVEVIDFGDETDKNLIYKELNGDSTNCLIYPRMWKHINEEVDPDDL